MLQVVSAALLEPAKYSEFYPRQSVNLHTLAIGPFKMAVFSCLATDVRQNTFKERRPGGLSDLRRGRAGWLGAAAAGSIPTVTGTLKHVKSSCFAVRWYRAAVV